MNKPTNTDDVIDSRDVIVRIEELEAERSKLEGVKETRLWDRENADELEALKALAAEAEPYAPDWEYGATLIRDSYFTDYAEELVKDCGYISKEFPAWIAIDWEATAEAMQQDYTTVEFDGVTYWVR